MITNLAQLILARAMDRPRMQIGVADDIRDIESAVVAAKYVALGLRRLGFRKSDRIAIIAQPIHAPKQFDAVKKVLERHPTRLRLVLNHAGLDVSLRSSNAFEDINVVCGLARNVNLAVKLSGMPCYSESKYPFVDLHEQVRKLIDWVSTVFLGERSHENAV